MKKIYRFLTCASLVTGLSASPAFAQTPSPSERGAGQQERQRERDKTSSGEEVGRDVPSQGTQTDPRGHTTADKNAGQAGSLTGQDRQFLTEALEGNHAEAELAKLAEQKATSQPVRELAQTLQKDHEQANDKLQSIAGGAGSASQPSVTPQHKQLQDRLSRLEGEAFDRAYAMEMVKDHEKDIAKYEKASKQLKHAELKAYASETLPHLKRHLEMARSAQNPTSRTK